MTVRSMTGFANAQGEIAGNRIELELRAVNHRFLDVQFKIQNYVYISLHIVIMRLITFGKIWAFRKRI